MTSLGSKCILKCHISRENKGCCWLGFKAAQHPRGAGQALLFARNCKEWPQIFSPGKISWGSDGTCGVQRLRHQQGHWNKAEAQTLHPKLLEHFSLLSHAVGSGSSTSMLAASSPVYSKDKALCAHSFYEWGCSGVLWASCQLPESPGGGVFRLVPRFGAVPAAPGLVPCSKGLTSVVLM